MKRPAPSLRLLTVMTIVAALSPWLIVWRVVETGAVRDATNAKETAALQRSVEQANARAAHAEADAAAANAKSDANAEQVRQLGATPVAQSTPSTTTSTTTTTTPAPAPTPTPAPKGCTFLGFPAPCL